jgi:hypothetical protein
MKIYCESDDMFELMVANSSAVRPRLTLRRERTLDSSWMASSRSLGPLASLTSLNSLASRGVLPSIISIMAGTKWGGMGIAPGGTR